MIVIFTLGRKTDFTYKTNQMIALLTLIVAAIGWLVTGGFLSGLYIGGGVFLTWALSRELDPKHGYSAFIAATFALLNLFYYENIQLMVIFWLLLLMRMVNGITGKALTVFDIFSVLGFTVYLSFSDENSIYLLIYLLAIAFVSKGREKSKAIFLAVGIGLVLFILESFLLDYLSFTSIDNLDTLTLFTLATLGLSFILFWFLSKEETKDDKGNRLNKSRLLASQMLFSSAILLFYFFGEISLNNLIIYMSAIVGIALYYIGIKLLNRD